MKGSYRSAVRLVGCIAGCLTCEAFGVSEVPPVSAPLPVRQSTLHLRITCQIQPCEGFSP